ncbi:hypothetical protein EDD16DRAFT_1694706 [Pisolithus croceorrhizus]|nr:hypothetical protein EDD16DRAFT_1694706 [Pisolithus croceorrhizus]
MSPEPSYLPSIKGKPGVLIDFLIVGGGITGLACALALRRIGHRVIVLERLDHSVAGPLHLIIFLQVSNGGGRLPPNASKILFQWGSRSCFTGVCDDTGDLLGTHIWEEEILREAGGEYLFYHHADLWRLLLRSAIDAGADVRLGVSVTSIDGDDCSVELSEGDVLRADVVVAACLYDSTPAYCRLYSLFVPSQVMLQDHDLVQMCIRPSPPAFLWLGHRASALGNWVGGVNGFMVHVWVSDYPGGSLQADEANWEDLISHCEPRLQRLVRGATFRAFRPVKIVPQLDNWVHHGGRVIMVGQAAHPLPVQLTALGIEDAALFAKLFSHLTSEDQIPAFLHAFQDLREGRCARVLNSERCNLSFRMMPNGPEQEERDSAMRERKLTEQWDQIKELFGYNCRR